VTSQAKLEKEGKRKGGEIKTVLIELLANELYCTIHIALYPLRRIDSSISFHIPQLKSGHHNASGRYIKNDRSWVALIHTLKSKYPVLLEAKLASIEAETL
jgi:hypothetical protein